MHLSAEGREDHDPPVPEFVEIPLHEDDAVVRNCARGLTLLFEVGGEVLGGERIQGTVVAQAANGLGPVAAQCLVGLAEEGPEGPSEFGGPTGTVAAPERDVAGLARRRRDDDTVRGDALDAPGGGTEDERLAGATFEDHLLVELADAGPAFAEVDGVEAAVGDRAAAEKGDGAGFRPRGDDAARAVPHHARAEVGEFVRRVGTREHGEDSVEGRPGQLGEWVGAADGRVERVGVHRLDGRHGHDLLGKDVERVAGDAQGLDGALVHPPDEQSALGEIPAVLGEDAAHAGRIEGVAGAPDPLDGAGDGFR